MDPNATIREIIERIEDGDEHGAALLCRSIVHWVDGGGFVPTFTRAQVAAVFTRLADALWSTAMGKRE